MRIIKALANRSILWLWSGQVFSAVGNEVYGVAFIWYCTQLIGTKAGYVSAIEAASIFFFGIFGGFFADHRDSRKVMIASDLIRGGAVALLPLASFFFPLNLWLLIAVDIVVASLAAFFNPALHALLPTLVIEREILQASNGLMETTNRFARVIGPGLIALFSRFLPLVHYFTVDAVSFFASAWSIRKVKSTEGEALIHSPSHWKETLSAGFRLITQDRLVSYMMISGGVVSASWLFIYPLGIALLLQARMKSQVASLAYAVFGYGLGNISSNLVLSGVAIRRPARLLFWGRVVGAIGFALMSFSQTLPEVMMACAVAAVGGPMTDLGQVNHLQDRYRGRDLVRVHRFGMALSYGCLLVVYLASPTLFAWFSVPYVILLNAAVIGILGIVGLLRFSPFH